MSTIVAYNFKEMTDQFQKCSSHFFPFLRRKSAAVHQLRTVFRDMLKVLGPVEKKCLDQINGKYGFKFSLKK